MNEILIPILAVTIIGLICGVGLAVASHVMAVKEDERFPAIRECLPGANCGACGFTGCDGYAKALLTPGTKTNLCVPGGAEAARKLAEVLGVEAEAVEPKVAIVRCGGDCEHTSPKEDYRGIASCQAAKLFFGGKGTCTYGCLGFGDCAKVCPHDAIYWNNGIAAIDQSVCVGCGLCAKTCPQQVIAIIPQSAKTAVLCSNHDKGAVTTRILPRPRPRPLHPANATEASSSARPASAFPSRPTRSRASAARFCPTCCPPDLPASTTIPI